MVWKFIKEPLIYIFIMVTVLVLMFFGIDFTVNQRETMDAYWRGCADKENGMSPHNYFIRPEARDEYWRGYQHSTVDPRAIEPKK